jgi:predicted nucleotidyltransferase
MRPSEALALHRDSLRALLHRHGFTQLRIFGSVLTGTDTEDSDLNVLAEYGPGMSGFGLGSAETEAGELLGVRVRVSAYATGVKPGAHALAPAPRFWDEAVRTAVPL